MRAKGTFIQIDDLKDYERVGVEVTIYPTIYLSIALYRYELRVGVNLRQLFK